MPQRSASSRMASRAARLVPTNRILPRSTQLPEEVHGVIEQGQGLFQVDDVDAVALSEDVRLHLRVPVAGLVTKMHASLEHLAHGNGTHGV